MRMIMRALSSDETEPGTPSFWTVGEGARSPRPGLEGGDGASSPLRVPVTRKEAVVLVELVGIVGQRESQPAQVRLAGGHRALALVHQQREKLLARRQDPLARCVRTQA